MHLEQVSRKIKNRSEDRRGPLLLGKDREDLEHIHVQQEASSWYSMVGRSVSR